jgi:hypothetical protein
MSDHVDSQLIFEGFDSFEGAVELVLAILHEYWIDPHESEGKHILKTFCRHASKDMYGDFERWRTCEHCELDFKPPLSLKYVFQIAESAPILCPACYLKWKKASEVKHRSEVQ